MCVACFCVVNLFLAWPDMGHLAFTPASPGFTENLFDSGSRGLFIFTLGLPTDINKLVGLPNIVFDLLPWTPMPPKPSINHFACSVPVI